MKKRVQSVALMLAILIVGMGLIVAVTEYAASADSDPQFNLTLNQFVTVLEQHGVAISDDRPLADHPLLRYSGTTLQAGSSLIEVYVYPSVAERVDDEQAIQQHILHLTAITTLEDAPLRMTSVRNLLLLYHADSSELAAAIQAAARALTSTASR